MADFNPVLAALTDSADILTVFLWFAAAGLLTLVGFYAVVAMRKWTLRRDAVATFTLQDLREMRGRGEINDREFATLRTQLLDQMGVTGEVPPTAADPGADDAGGASAAGDDAP